jgi:hypothetical protein
MPCDRSLPDDEAAVIKTRVSSSSHAAIVMSEGVDVLNDDTETPLRTVSIREMRAELMDS